MLGLYIMRRDHLHKDNIPAEFLVANRTLLGKGKALDIAMGAGRNAVYLAKEGFDVLGIEIAPDAVEKAIALAAAENVKVSTIVADLEGGYHLEPSAYDLIICFYYLHRPLIAEIKKALKPGGVVVYETYLCDQAQWGKPANPDHLLKHDELLNMFCDWRITKYREGIIEPRKAIASIIACKPAQEDECGKI
jgi:SAM-dependent methyltransferase